MARDADLLVKPGLVIPGDELHVTTSRASGPGGQHVNTTESRVQLRWNPVASRALDEGQRARLTDALAARLTAAGDLVIACDAERSQHRNRDEARRRLADLVRRALVRRKPRRATKVPRAARMKRLEQKTRRSRLKQLRRRPKDD